VEPLAVSHGLQERFVSFTTEDLARKFARPAILDTSAGRPVAKQLAFSASQSFASQFGCLTKGL